MPDVQGQIVPPKPKRSTAIDYETIPFTARHVDCEDSRFFVTGPGFPLVGGFRLTSRDRALYSIAWFEGSMSSGILRDGRGIVIMLGSLNEIRVARTIELAEGWLPPSGREEAPTHPEIAGYRFVMSDRVTVTDDYLGLWQRLRGRAETLIVSFRPATSDHAGNHAIVGRLPLRLASISVHSPLHFVSWSVELVSEARPGAPLYLLHYDWFPATFLRLPGAVSGDPRAICRTGVQARRRNDPETADLVIRGERIRIQADDER